MKFSCLLLLLIPAMSCNAQSLKGDEKPGEVLLTSLNFNLLKNYILKNGKKTKDENRDIIYTDNIHNTRFGVKKHKDFTAIEISKIKQEKIIFSSYYVSDHEGKITITIKDFDEEKSKLVYEGALTDLAGHLDHVNRLLRGERKLEFFKKHLKKDLTLQQIEAIFGVPDADNGSGAYVYRYYIDKGIITISHNGTQIMRAWFLGKDAKEEII